jgi:hypothetical protein
VLPAGAVVRAGITVGPPTIQVGLVTIGDLIITARRLTHPLAHRAEAIATPQAASAIGTGVTLRPSTVHVGFVAVHHAILTDGIRVTVLVGAQVDVTHAVIGVPVRIEHIVQWGRAVFAGVLVRRGIRWLIGRDRVAVRVRVRVAVRVRVLALVAIPFAWAVVAGGIVVNPIEGSRGIFDGIQLIPIADLWNPAVSGAIGAG